MKNLDKDYAYPTVEDYEEIVGFKVNEAFKMGWDMARTTNSLFKILAENLDKTKDMNVIKYETPSAKFQEFREQGPVIFLAGPTVRGNQPHLTSWRIAAVEEFQKRNFKGTLILPEFEDKFESDQFRYDLPAWEFAGLDAADVIMFWIPRTRELIGLTTNHEFGYWLAREPLKMVYGRPDDAYRMKYLDLMWDIENIRMGTGAEGYYCNSLEWTVKESIYLAENNYKSRK